MEDFLLFDEAIATYERKCSPKTESTAGGELKVCTHAEVVSDNGVVICTYCGEEI